MERKAVSIDTKKKIITLHEVGMSKHMISKHCETQSVATKPGSGRKPKLTERQKRAIKIEQLHYNSISLNDLVKFVQINFDVTVRRSIISEILNSFSLFSYVAPKNSAINRQQRKNRVDWCREHLERPMDNWTKIILSDESCFELLNRKNRIYIRRYQCDGQQYKRSQSRSHKCDGL
ncbi:unnamed protein product, partial [Rotaria sordida]